MLTHAGATADAPAGECSSIADLAGATPSLSTLFTAVSAAPIVAAALSDLEEDFTVFAPSDDAFAVVPEEPLMALLDETAALEFILTLHVVPGAVMAADLSDGDVLQTINGANLTVSVTDGTVAVMAPEGGTVGTVTTADVEACNGVVHIIDALLIPGGGVDSVAPGPGAMPMGGAAGGYGDVEPVSTSVPTPVTPTGPMPTGENRCPTTLLVNQLPATRMFCIAALGYVCACFLCSQVEARCVRARVM